MAKTKFVCKNCGYESPKWLGRCPVCGEWNTFVEIEEKGERPSKRGLWVYKSESIKLNEAKRKFKFVRYKTGIEEFDRVTGKGLVAGSIVIVGGSPGIGKSTLVFQVIERIAENYGLEVLYNSSEESIEQVVERAKRLGIDSPHIEVANLTFVEEIVEKVENGGGKVLVVDSIQTVMTEELESVPGSVTQVRESAAKLLHLAKSRGVLVILIGHVTKDGTLAGPRTLEHMVDAIFQLEERGHGLRILRALKNRYGSTEEIGIFEMTEKGLLEVKDPSLIYITSRKRNLPGVTVVPIMEGTRPILIEVEALVASTPYTVPQRNATGYDLRRLAMLLALIENKIGVSLRTYDVFVNITGGIKVTESSADLAIILAILSSYYKRPVASKTFVLGEVGLTGEVRPVRDIKRRLNEAKRLGFKRAIVPQNENVEVHGLEIIRVENIKEAVKACFS